MAVDIDAIISTLKDGVMNLAKDSIKNFVKQAEADLKVFIEASKVDMKRWAQKFADGDLTKDELETLVIAKKARLKAQALTQAGLAAIEVTKFREGVMKLVIETIGKVVP